MHLLFGCFSGERGDGCFLLICTVFGLHYVIYQEIWSTIDKNEQKIVKEKGLLSIEYKD